MHKEKKEKNFIKKPEYEGGDKALKKFIGENLRYPDAALQNRTEGSVHIRYSISHKGEVRDVKVISGIGHGCDEEAIRLVKLLKFKTFAAYKMQVEFHKNIHIHFKLSHREDTKIVPPQEMMPAPEMSIQYTIVSAPPANEKTEEKKSGGGYSFTIPL